MIKHLKICKLFHTRTNIPCECEKTVINDKPLGQMITKMNYDILKNDKETELIMGTEIFQSLKTLFKMCQTYNYTNTRINK